jgi:aldose 1-epimerase
MSEPILLEAARTRVTVAPGAGGRVAQIEALHRGTWTSLLHAPEDFEAATDPMSWGSFVMAPWPNRIANGRFSWRDRTFEVPANFGAHAIHGVCFDRPWRVEATSETTCVLSIVFNERWPSGGRCVQRIEVLDDGVVQTAEVHATDGAFPAGIGWHPWFRRTIGGAEHVHAQVEASQRYELADMIPTGRLLPVEDEYDLRRYRRLADRRLDDCYRGLASGPRLLWDDLELWMESSDNVTHAVVYTPEDAVCIEPQTCAIDAFNLEARGVDPGIAVVVAGRPLVASTQWRWATAEPQWQERHEA